MRQKVAEVGRPNNKSGFLLLRRPYDCVYCVAQPGLPLYAKSLGGQGVKTFVPLQGCARVKNKRLIPEPELDTESRPKQWKTAALLFGSRGLNLN